MCSAPAPQFGRFFEYLLGLKAVDEQASAATDPTHTVEHLDRVAIWAGVHDHYRP